MASRNSCLWMKSVALGVVLASAAWEASGAPAGNEAAPSKTQSNDPAKGAMKRAPQAVVKTASPASKAGPAPVEAKKSYYVPTRGYRLEPQPDIPPYVRNLGKTYKQFEGIDWLDVGLDSRTRFEYRKNDYRPWTDTSTNPASSKRRYFPNSLWLLRTRAYIGVKEILDPFRFVVEFQDSRAFNSIYELQGQEINEADLISGYGELYFKDALGKDDRGNDRPLSVRAGRFHLEVVDRRLIAENEFRNTTNTFDGLRIKLGKRDNDWDLDNFAMRPVVRLPYEFDRPDWQNWVYGSVLSVRRWSEFATIQPYFIGRKQYGDPSSASAASRVSRETYSPGLRVYGVLGNFDYDVDVTKQFGQIGEYQPFGGPSLLKSVRLDAIAYAFEAGYTYVDHPWKPRISVNYAYGSGDKSPFDNANQTLDILYGFNQPFSRNDYFAWNNVKAPKIRLEFTPTKNLQIDTAFGGFWLASTAAAWDRANLYAPLGNRGGYLGSEVDVRVRYKLSQYINITASYARFWPGSFPSSFGPPVIAQTYFPQSFRGQTTTTNGLTAQPTDFFYLEATANAFGDGQPITSNPAQDVAGIFRAQPSSPASTPMWRDFYVGLNGGAAWSSPRSTVSVGPISRAQPSLPVAATSNMLPANFDLSGFLGGGQIGWNWKFKTNVVAGLETDLHGVSGNTDRKDQATKAWSIGNTFVNYGVRSATLNFLGTARGRLGYLATPSVLLYGTGGLAYGGVTSNAALFTYRVGGFTITQGNPLNQETRVGWTAGGGLEWALSPNWSAKAEYLHYDLGTATAMASVFHPSGFYGYGVLSQTKFDGNVVHAGLNRHFDMSAK